MCKISGPGTLAAGQSLFPFASVAEVLRLGGLWSGLSGWVIFSTLVEQETLTMLAEDCQRWRGLPAGYLCVPGWLGLTRGRGRGQRVGGVCGRCRVGEGRAGTLSAILRWHIDVMIAWVMMRE